MWNCAVHTTNHLFKKYITKTDTLLTALTISWHNELYIIIL